MGVVVFGGVDTHRDAHVAALVDSAGRLLGSESFTAERAGYRRMVAWFGSQGCLVRVGVEGTGSYGAGPGCANRFARIDLSARSSWPPTRP